MIKAKSLFTKPYENPIGWFPILITILSIVVLFVTNYYFSATFLLVTLIGTILVIVRENHLRRTEIFRKVRLILNEIKLARKLCKNWTTQNYPNLCCPLSPCVSCFIIIIFCGAENKQRDFNWFMCVRLLH